MDSTSSVEEKQKEKSFVLCNFRLSPDESEELERVAADAHLTKTAYIKERIFAPPVAAEVVKMSGELVKMRSDLKDVSRRLFEVEKAVSVQTQRTNATKKDVDVLMGKGNAIMFAVSIFGTACILTVTAAAVVLRRMMM